jgi:hypothetical protein
MKAIKIERDKEIKGQKDRKRERVKKRKRENKEINKEERRERKSRVRERSLDRFRRWIRKLLPAPKARTQGDGAPNLSFCRPHCQLCALHRPVQEFFGCERRNSL